MMLFDYNSHNNKYYKKRFDELGLARHSLHFKYYDCPCGESKYCIVSTTTRHRNHFDVVQCANCGMLRINPYMTDKSIDKYYKKIYGSVKRAGESSKEIYERQQKLSKVLYEKINNHLHKGQSLLDFGGGSGGLMAEFQDKEFEVYIKESDVDHEKYAIDKGLKKFDENKKYDAIFLSHVVEHINQPIEFLRHVKDNFLQKNGLIYIEVPYIENAKRSYLLNDFHIAHKFYFSEISLKYFVGLAGFAVKDKGPNFIIITPSENVQLLDKIEFMQLSNKVIRRNRHKSNYYLVTQRIKKLFRNNPS